MHWVKPPRSRSSASVTAPSPREARALGIDTRVCPGRFFAALGQVEELIRDEGFELIHSHGSRGNLAGALLARRTRLPIVSTIHSDWKLDYMGRPMAAMTYGVLNSWALRHIKYHVGVSDAMRRPAHRARLPPQRHLRHI